MKRRTNPRRHAIEASKFTLTKPSRRGRIKLKRRPFIPKGKPELKPCLVPPDSEHKYYRLGYEPAKLVKVKAKVKGPTKKVRCKARKLRLQSDINNL